MKNPERSPVNPMLRDWLRNEHRLGVPHWAVPPRATAKSVPSPKRPTGAREQSPGAALATTRPEPPSKPQTSGVQQQQSSLAFSAVDPDLPLPCQDDLSLKDAEKALNQLDVEIVRGCTKCRLHEHRTQTVFGVGLARPELVFVGEGPGADEDAQGIPFVGRAGQLLTRMIAAMTLTRDQVYICNIVKCRPPGNRTPTEDEMEVCGPYLLRQLAILRPKVIVALGRPATQTLLATKAAISRLRGQLHEFPPPALAHHGLPSCQLMPTYHPAYLLRNPPAKADTWADLQQVMELLGIDVPPRS